MNKDRIKAFLTSPRSLKIAVALGMAAIILIFVSSYVDFGCVSDAGEQYADELQIKLHEILSSIDGVGEVKVFLTMDNSGENVYKDHSDNKLKSITPTVRGVVIVCDGGDDPLIVSRVMSAVTSSLAVTSDKVSITKLK